MEIEIGGEARRIGRQAACALTALGLFALMAGCGGGGGGGDAGGGSAPTFAIGGSVSGLSGTGEMGSESITASEISAEARGNRLSPMSRWNS